MTSSLSVRAGHLEPSPSVVSSSKPALCPERFLEAIHRARPNIRSSAQAWTANVGPHATTVTGAARAIGRDSATIHRWLREGRVPLRSAEDAADALGLHPFLIWGDDYYTVAGAS